MKNELTEIFRGFQVSEYALMVKNENLKMPEINKKLSKLKKDPVVTVIITRKLVKCNQFVT